MKGKKTHPSGRAWWREYRMTCLVLAAAWPLLEEILQRIGSMTG